MADMLFKVAKPTVEDLISDVKNGSLGLPTIQRDYVWDAKKVRDLLDSMLKGYPIGYIMIWNASDDMEGPRQIGKNIKSYSAPQSVIIDGQQRLTSLYSSMYGEKITDAKFNETRVVISFNPLESTFKVANSVTKRSSDWIYDISEAFLYTPCADDKSTSYIDKTISFIEERRKKSGKELASDDKENIKQNISELLKLKNYILPTLQIKGKTDEEDVANIFVRVNSKGTKLGEDDFILTLISLYWLEGRKKIQDFCQSAIVPKKNTAYNYLFHPSPTHIVRITMSFGFQRARLRYAYMLLRGRDFEKGVYSDELREEQFEKLKVVLEKVLNVQVWKDFLKCVEVAGFITENMISSENALVYSYALYLIGKYDFKVSNNDLRKIFPKWFFMVAVSGYYKASSDTVMETDLLDLRKKKTAKEFISYLEEKIESVFTDDYFNNILPNSLANSKANNPAWHGYCAALNIIGARVLFSTLYTRSLFDPTEDANKKAIEKHHLFPKAYLASIGISEDRDRNQNANYAYIEWTDNIELLDTSPAEYMKNKLANISDKEKEEMYANHALPIGWEKMDYFDFLNRRRKLMAQVIKRGYEQL